MGSRRLVLGSLLLAAACATYGTDNDSTPTSRGAALFQRHCAVCHGTDGAADTKVAQLLRPRPAAFDSGLFKLVSTSNGVPTQEDLVAMLRRGMPGSTMMSFGWMADDDLRALADEVRRLAIAGRAATITETATLGGQGLEPGEALTIAGEQLTPGARVATGVDGPIDVAEPQAGRRLYERHCANCHGPDGRGLTETADWTTDGTWLWPRDFTSGYLRGSGSHEALATRIRAGMPGAHMPPAALSAPETQALVAYVASLIPDAARDRHAQWRRTLRVPRIDALPEDGDRDGFAALESVRLPLAPLRWRPDAVSEVHLRIAHDGTDLLWQLEWDDPTRDDRPRVGAPMGDGVAVQFAMSDDQPLFAMGSEGRPVNVWRWHAFDPKETAGLVDLIANAAHSGLDVAAPTRPDPRVESLRLGGIGSAATETTSGLPLTATTRWFDGRWTATFRRPIAARSEREVDLAQNRRVLFALAVWDGSIDAHAGSKAITTWHVLELQR